MSITDATSSQVGIDGGATAVSICLLKTARYGSSAIAGSSHAAETDGRSLTAVYHSTWTSGRVSHSTNVHAASRTSESLKTARSAPPMKDASCSPAGSVARATFYMPAASSSLRIPTCHGPETNDAILPAMKSGSREPCGRSVGARPSVKNDW